MSSHPKPRWYFLIRRYVSENWTHIWPSQKWQQFACKQTAGCRPKKGMVITASSPWNEFSNQWFGRFFFARRLTMAKKICTSTNQSSIKWKWNIFFSKMMNGTCQCIPWRIWRLHLLVRQIGGTEIQGLAAYWYIRRSKSGRSEFDFLQLGFAWQTEHTKDPLKIEEFHEIQIWNVEASRKQQDGGIWYTCSLPSYFLAAKIGLNQGKWTHFCRMFAHAKMGAV